MSLLNNILGVSAYWQVNKDLAKKTSIDCALLLSDLISKYSYFEDKEMLIEFRSDYYFFATAESIEADTTLSYKVQKRTIDELKKHGLIKTKLMGVPAKLHFTICEDKILQLLQTSSYKKSILDKQKSQNLYNNKNKENKNKEKKINNDFENLQFSESETNQSLKDLKKVKEKSSAKKESEPVEVILHPCDKTKEYGTWIETHGDGELHNLLANFYSENPTKYEGAMYAGFKAYWTALVLIGRDKGKELWRTQKTFSVAGRLSQWATKYKPQHNGNNNNQTRQLDAINTAKEAMDIVRERDRIRNGYSATE